MILQYFWLWRIRPKAYQRVALQTAKVMIYGDRAPVMATVLFDPGSDHSYVTNALVRQVRPNWLSFIKLAYSAFGGGKLVLQYHNVFEIRAKGSNNRNGVCGGFYAVEVPVICTPLQHFKILLSSLE